MSDAMAAQGLAAGHVRIATMRFGAAEMVVVDPSNIYIFPEALPGLPESHRYALIADAAYAPLRWLQSLDEPAVCLPVLSPDALALHEYGAHAARAAGPEGAEHAGRVLLVTRYDAASRQFVTNLLAPILLDPGRGTGAQIVLEGQIYPLRQPLRWHPDSRTFAVPC